MESLLIQPKMNAIVATKHLDYIGDLKPQIKEGITKVKWVGPKKLKKVKKNIYANIEALI